MSILGWIVVAVVLIAIFVGISIKRENRRRARQFGSKKKDDEKKDE